MFAPSHNMRSSRPKKSEPEYDNTVYVNSLRALPRGESKIVLDLEMLEMVEENNLDALLKGLPKVGSLVVNFLHSTERSFPIVQQIIREQTAVTNVVLVNHSQWNDTIDAICGMRSLERVEIYFPQEWDQTWRGYLTSVPKICAAILARNTRGDGTPPIQTLAFNNYSDPASRGVNHLKALFQTGGLSAFEIRNRPGSPWELLSPAEALVKYAADSPTIQSISLEWFSLEKSAPWFSGMPSNFKTIRFKQASCGSFVWERFMEGCAASATLRVLDLDTCTVSVHSLLGLWLAAVALRSSSLEVLRCVNSRLPSQDAQAVADAANGNRWGRPHVLDLQESERKLGSTVFHASDSLVRHVRDTLQKVKALFGDRVEDAEISADLTDFCPDWVERGWHDSDAILTKLLCAEYLSRKIKAGFPLYTVHNSPENVLVRPLILSAALAYFAALSAKTPNPFVEVIMNATTTADIHRFCMKFVDPIAKNAMALLVKERTDILENRQVKAGMFTLESGAGIRNTGTDIHRFLNRDGDHSLTWRIHQYLRPKEEAHP
jgi:hypothetical protein